MPAKDDAAMQVERLVRDTGTSFYWAMRFQPREKKKAIFAVYAFCRAVDDVADSDEPVKTKIRQLKTWREAIENLFNNKPGNVITQALIPAKDAHKLKKKVFLAIIDGMEMDATGPMQAPSRKELDLYCARVASAVGLLCIRIFGEAGKAGHELADALGRALQLTNILRDLKEDADWERLYLPSDLLKKHGIETTNPKKVLNHPSLDAVCRELAEQAEQEFSRAEQAMAKCNAHDIRPAKIMKDVYYKILQRLKKRGWGRKAVHRAKPPMAKIEKLFIALKVALT